MELLFFVCHLHKLCVITFTHFSEDMEEDMDEDCTNLSNTQRHQLNHRELYLSRQLDTLPATHIRYLTYCYIKYIY